MDYCHLYYGILCMKKELIGERSNDAELDLTLRLGLPDTYKGKEKLMELDEKHQHDHVGLDLTLRLGIPDIDSKDKGKSVNLNEYDHNLVVSGAQTQGHLKNSLSSIAAAAGASASGGRVYSPRSSIIHRCCNRFCNATTTPLWRKGPLGAKSLCNACGIKYRKHEVRKPRADDEEM